MQTLLPLLPAGSTQINEILGVVNENNQWIYYSGLSPVFSHAKDDFRSFKLITSQWICQGSCRQIDIVKAFGVSEITMKRAVKKFREGGTAAFFEPVNRRGGTVFNEKNLLEAQSLFNEGYTRKEVCQKLGIKLDTLKKALQSDRLTESKINKIKNGSTKSERTRQDAKFNMGTGCSREIERTGAAFGQICSASLQFENCQDLNFGGVLCALPALEANGLFQFLKDHFNLPSGYYDVSHIVTTLAFMALCRIKTNEQLRFETPGELGKLLGLDRIPEVKTLRKKIKQLCNDQNSSEWMLRLSKFWMENNENLAGSLFIDGHVRVYNGEQTKLPRRFVSREKLCLRGVTDYYINDALGQPFFVVNQIVNIGMSAVIIDKIVPQLLDDVPNQPTEVQLEEDRYLHRFILVFDRESSNQTLFKQLWDEHRIACISYRKNVKEKWPEAEFKEEIVEMPNGEILKMRLAQRGTLLGKNEKAIWVKEVRKLTETGHQTSFISTAYTLDSMKSAALMFSRWSQENYFAYMMKHYNLDRLIDYEIQVFPDPLQRVINPIHRDLDYKVRSLRQKLSRKKAEFGACELELEKVSGKKTEELIQKKANMKENIDLLEHDLESVKAQRKATPKHVNFNQLPDDYQFQTLAPSRKMFSDTIKMVAYRSETAMANILKEKLSKEDDARRLVCDLLRSEADLIPDPENNILHIHLHRMANPQADQAVQHLINFLNETETLYPGTNLTLKYSFVT
jgi:transposase